MEKKALRIIYYIFIIFLENKLLKVKVLCLFQLGQFTNSYNNNTLPHILYAMFPKNQFYHNYPTRNSNEFHIPLYRTLLAKNTFIYTTALNSGTSFLSVSLNAFKHKFKLFLLYSYNSLQRNWHSNFRRALLDHPYIFYLF